MNDIMTLDSYCFIEMDAIELTELNGGIDVWQAIIAAIAGITANIGAQALSYYYYGTNNVGQAANYALNDYGAAASSLMYTYGPAIAMYGSAIAAALGH